MLSPFSPVPGTDLSIRVTEAQEPEPVSPLGLVAWWEAILRQGHQEGPQEDAGPEEALT